MEMAISRFLPVSNFDSVRQVLKILGLERFNVMFQNTQVMVCLNSDRCRTNAHIQISHLRYKNRRWPQKAILTRKLNTLFVMQILIKGYSHEKSSVFWSI